MRCACCGNMVYPKIAPAVIVGVIYDNKILMTKYSDREYKKYALIAGFTEIGETAEETVRREVMEEVGLHVKNIRYYKSQPWALSGSLLAGFFCELDGDDTISRDLNKGLNPSLPVNYYVDNDPFSVPELTWRNTSNTLYTNWLNFYVYQMTPYLLDDGE